MALGALATVAVASKPLRLTAAETGGEEMEVPAVEDLMREHGIMRRALLVYAETASRLSAGKESIPLDALGRTAVLFRQFGEDYHERSLEEQHVFPPLLDAGRPHVSLVKTLTAQHQRGRQITDYISAITRKRRVVDADAAPLGKVLTSFVRMYEHHAAIEDTIVFPAWKETISSSQYPSSRSSSRSSNTNCSARMASRMP
jgi:hemerythrin-like domain-containing protein